MMQFQSLSMQAGGLTDVLPNTVSKGASHEEMGSVLKLVETYWAIQVVGDVFMSKSRTGVEVPVEK